MTIPIKKNKILILEYLKNQNSILILMLYFIIFSLLFLDEIDFLILLKIGHKRIDYFIYFIIK